MRSPGSRAWRRCPLRSRRPVVRPMAAPQPRLVTRAPLLILVALLGFASRGTAQQVVGASAGGLDSIARSVFESDPNSAVSVAVLRGDTLILARGHGNVDVLPGSPPATATTVYRIGSVTKQFTAAAVLQLVQRGLVGLDDPVARFIPEYMPPESPTISIRQLLAPAGLDDIAYCAPGATGIAPGHTLPGRISSPLTRSASTGPVPRGRSVPPHPHSRGGAALWPPARSSRWICARR